MTLKEQTADSHARAEATSFMKAVFEKRMTKEAWTDFTFQKYLMYDVLELKADTYNLLDDIQDIKRAKLLKEDFDIMSTGPVKPRPSVQSYMTYITNLHDPAKIMAHIYVWHMGDLFGGQMIKKIVEGSHKSLEFTDVNALKEKIRAKLDDSMGAEANVAFEYAIKILNSYKI